jgi:hypothetical protein
MPVRNSKLATTIHSGSIPPGSANGWCDTHNVRPPSSVPVSMLAGPRGG